MQYKKIATYLLLTFGMLVITGCASNVRTKINTFIAPSAPIGTGSIAVVPFDDGMIGSLEFGFYRDQLEQKLVTAGYRINNENPDYLAQLAFSVSQKEVGSTRFGTVVFGGGFGFSHFYNRNNLIFTQQVEDRFEFERLVRMTIIKNQDTPAANNTAIADSPNLLEITARSLGRCENLTAVFEPMLRGIFQNLTRANGSVVTVKTSAEAGC